MGGVYCSLVVLGSKITRYLTKQNLHIITGISLKKKKFEHKLTQHICYKLYTIFKSVLDHNMFNVNLFKI